VVVAPGRLHQFIAAALGDLDVPEQDAATVALSLVQAELEGLSGHGAIRRSWNRSMIQKSARVAW